MMSSEDMYAETLKSAFDLVKGENKNVGLLFDGNKWSVGPTWGIGEECPDSKVIVYIGPGHTERTGKQHFVYRRR